MPTRYLADNGSVIVVVHDEKTHLSDHDEVAQFYNQTYGPSGHDPLQQKVEYHHNGHVHSFYLDLDVIQNKIDFGIWIKE